MVYIGSAINFKKRQAYHLSKLRRKEHDNPYLQNSWDKYGESSFEFIILEEIEDVKIILEREQWWIDNTFYKYNICKTAGNCAGRKHTEEAKNKISFYNTHLKVYSNETKDKISKSKMKKVIQYTKSMELVKEWDSIGEAAKFMNCTQSNITLCLKGINKTARKFIWKYKNN